ncbi:hypothetical protein ACXYMU_03695 [Pontibacter sp. CAU 1760]
MKEISIRLFEGAYTIKPRAERRIWLLAVLAVVVQLGLLVYLSVTKIFTIGLVLVLLLNLVVPAYLFLNAWLDRKPRYRRHLTLTEKGVRYRARFRQQLQEFDWEEIDTVQIGLYQVVFLLKNEEEHSINLEHIRNDEILAQVKEQIREMVAQKEIILR